MTRSHRKNRMGFPVRFGPPRSSLLLLSAALLCGVGTAPSTAHAAGAFSFCADWSYSYNDTDNGEDFLLHNQTARWGRIPAAYSYLRLLRNGGVHWEGFTDEQGCSPPVSLPVGGYELQRFTHIKPDAREFKIYPNDGEGFRTFGWTFEIKSPIADGQYSTRTPYGGGDPIASAAAVMTDAAIRRLSLELPGGVYTVYADQMCKDGKGNTYAACRKGDAIYLGWDANGVRRAMWKTVVAHELGHLVQRKMFGGDVKSWREMDNASWPKVCRCDHISEDQGKSHCLQSLEHVSAAQVEGWGHFFAMHFLNLEGDRNPAFPYYKTFYYFGREWYPPVALRIGGPVKWRESFCPWQGAGVELDWAAFYWAMHTRSTNRYSMNDFAAVYQEACGGSCADTLVYWPDIVNAAAALWGSGHPKVQALRDTGIAYGIP